MSSEARINSASFGGSKAVSLRNQVQLCAGGDAAEDVEGRKIEVKRRVAREAVGVVDAVVLQRPGRRR